MQKHDRNKSVIGHLHSNFMDAKLCFTPAKLPPNRKVTQNENERQAALAKAEERRQARLKRRMPK